MARLSKVKNNSPIPIGVEGIFIHNMPAKQMQDIFGGVNERLSDEPEAVIVELFTKLICDEGGHKFEDVDTYEEICLCYHSRTFKRSSQALVKP